MDCIKAHRKHHTESGILISQSQRLLHIDSQSRGAWCAGLLSNVQLPLITRHRGRRVETPQGRDRRALASSLRQYAPARLSLTLGSVQMLLVRLAPDFVSPLSQWKSNQLL